VVSMKRSVRTATVAGGLLLSVLLAPGCIFSPKSGGDPGGPTVIPKNDSVGGAIDLYKYVWSNKDYENYQLLLHDGFQYYPQTTDLQDFPWLTADWWGRTDELGMARNMFNPDFQPADPHAGAIQSITMTIDSITQQDDPQEGGTLVTAHAVAQVMYNATTGAKSDVRFEFLIVPDPNNAGLYQIKRQKELPLNG
jgi:hypothetical protein